MDQTTRKHMTRHQALHPWDDVDKLFVLTKKEEEDLPAFKMASMYRYNDKETKLKSAEEDWLQPQEIT